MKTTFKIIVLFVDFVVGFIFSAASSVFFGIMCFPINTLIRSTLIVYLYKDTHNKSDHDLYKMALIQSSIGALGYLVGSIVGLCTYLFILLPSKTIFGGILNGISYNNSLDQMVALRSGTLCVASNLIIYIFIVTLIAVVYIKIQESDHSK